MILTFPIKTVSEANRRDHWTVKNNRKNAQQKEFMVTWRNAKAKVKLPATIIFTRYSCQILDDDNLQSALKGCRDQLAKEIGVDDGSDLLNFVYRQEKINKREHWFTVEIKDF
jgi:hypothetical protein